MSPSHLRAFCLLTSCFIHWLLLAVSWGPAVPLSLGCPRTSFESEGATAAARPGFSLQQMVDQVTGQKEKAGADRQKQILAQYLKQVKIEINRRKFSQAGMDREQMIGNVAYAFDIDALGVFHDICLIRSSGRPLMDRAAGTAIGLASHKVKRPKATGSRTLTLKVTVKYQYGL